MADIGPNLEIAMVSKTKIENAWERAHEIRGENPAVWRKDEMGHKIRKASYGTTGDYGWEIDHRNPVSKGGTNNDRNLRALHWEANRKKSDKY